MSTLLKSQHLCNPDYFGTQKESGTTSYTINKSIEFKGWLFVELVSSNGTMEDNSEVLQNKALSGKIVNKHLNRPLNTNKFSKLTNHGKNGIFEFLYSVESKTLTTKNVSKVL